MEKELKKAKFRLMTLEDESIFHKFALQMHNDFSAHTRFAFMQLYSPFVRVFMRETEHFLLLILHDVVRDRVACLPPLGDWETYSIKRPIESYRSFFRTAGAAFVMIDIRAWMLPKLREAGLDGMCEEYDAEESDCLFMAQDYALSLKREQTRQELEKIQSAHSLKWVEYTAQNQEMFYQAVKSVYASRLKKLDAEKLYQQLFEIISSLDVKLCMLVSENNMLGLLGYRLTEDQLEILLYYAAMRPKGVEAVVRQRICQSLENKTRKIFIAGAYYEKSLITGKQAELRSQQLFNYVIKEK